MKVVLDTNSLLVSIGRKSKYRPIFDAFLTGKISLLLSNDTYSEYVEIITQKANELVATNLGDLLMSSPHVIKVDIFFKWSMISEDADDNKFVDCALNGEADYLVTDDRHFLALKETGFPFVKVIKTNDFLEKIKGSDT